MPVSNYKRSLCHKYRNNLLNNMTYSELIFKQLLDELGIRYLSQKGFIKGNGFYIVDFYIPKPYKLCIEIDGGYHSLPKQIIKDKNKDRYLISRGFRVLRISNNQVKDLSSSDVFNMICCNI